MARSAEEFLRSHNYCPCVHCIKRQEDWAAEIRTEERRDDCPLCAQHAGPIPTPVAMHDSLCRRHLTLTLVVLGAAEVAQERTKLRRAMELTKAAAIEIAESNEDCPCPSFISRDLNIDTIEAELDEESQRGTSDSE